MIYLLLIQPTQLRAQLSSQHFEYMPKTVGILGSDHTVQFCLKGGGLNLLKISTFVPSYNRCWTKYLLLGIRNGKITNATHSGPTTFLSSEFCASLLLLINNIVLQLSHNSHDPILPICTITFQNLMIKRNRILPYRFQPLFFWVRSGLLMFLAQLGICPKPLKGRNLLRMVQVCQQLCLLQWSDAPKLIRLQGQVSANSLQSCHLWNLRKASGKGRA